MDKKYLLWIWIPIVAILNFIGVQIAIFLKIPFFLDTWATSLGVMIGGLWVGLAGGVLYNLYMGFFVWTETFTLNLGFLIIEDFPIGWIWAFINAWVALSVFYLFKKGWVDIKKPGKLLLSAILVGITSAVIIIGILFSVWGGVETYEGVLPTYDALEKSTGSKTIAAISEKFITTPIDQIVSVFIAAIVFSSLSKKYKVS